MQSSLIMGIRGKSFVIVDSVGPPDSGTQAAPLVPMAPQHRRRVAAGAEPASSPLPRPARARGPCQLVATAVPSICSCRDSPPGPGRTKPRAAGTVPYCLRNTHKGPSHIRALSVSLCAGSVAWAAAAAF